MKRVLLSIFSVLILTIATISATYAYYVSSASGTTNSVSGHGEEFDVIYVGGDPLSGNLPITSSRTEDFKTTVRIRLASGSASAKANIYIKLTQISSVLASDMLVWEVEATNNGNSVPLATTSGDFSTCPHGNTTGTCQSGDKLYVVTGYDLLYTDTEFTIYIWLNGAKVTNEVIGATFSAYVGAETENITGVTPAS